MNVMRRAGFACWVSLILVMSTLTVQAQAEIITTQFASNNGAAGNMFDINVLAPGGLTMKTFELNLVGGNWDINLYTIDGTYLGNETTPAAWTLIDSITGLASAGTDNPTLWDIADYPLAPGPQAFYIEVTNGFGMRYTNGTGEGNLFVSDGNIEIFEGTGNFSNFGLQFRPRIWNGSIQYAVPEPQTAVFLLAAASLTGFRLRRRSD